MTSDRGEQKKTRPPRRAREMLEVTLRCIGDAVIVSDVDGRVTFLNPVAERLTGWPIAQACGRPFEQIFQIVNEHTGAAVEHPVANVLRTGGLVGLADHTMLITREGRRVPIEDSGAPVRLANGELVGVVVVFRDITERKRAERALRAADRQKDEFLATLAHELRNPLAPICAAAELLKHAKSLAPELRAATAILERQARQMTRLVDDLLDVSRITSGRIRLQHEPIDLHELLRAVLESYRQSLETARRQVTLAASEPAHVSGDRTRLTQVFSNILHNAVKYTPPGGRIEISLRKADGRATVSVRDDGMGIPTEMLEHIFEPFAQLDRSFERPNGGLGIGLTLAKRLVELHQGHVEARSAGRGKGAEFVISLPAIATPALDAAGVAEPGSEPARSRRVLIADDNHDAGISLGMLLQSMGHDTRVVHDGVEALEEAEHFHPEVVLLDIGMPRLDGYETARHIASRPWAAATRIVAVTGWGQEADRQRANEAGFHRHLVKPVDLGALREVMADESEAPG
jgi:PAS domain S-box-containing protein